MVPSFQLWYFVFLILISNFCAICCNYTCQLHFLDFTSNKTKLHQILSQRRCIANASRTTQRHPLQNIIYYAPNIPHILINYVFIVLVALLTYSVIAKTTLYYPIYKLIIFEFSNWNNMIISLDSIWFDLIWILQYTDTKIMQKQSENGVDWKKGIPKPKKTIRVKVALCIWYRTSMLEPESHGESCGGVRKRDVRTDVKANS